MADLPIGSDEGADVVEIIQSSTQNKLAIASDGSLNTFADQTGSGTITALNGTVIATVDGCSMVTFNITGTWSATLMLEASVEGTTWVGVVGILPGSIALEVIGSNEIVAVPCGGFYQIRIRASAFTSGTVDITWNAGAGTQIVGIYNTSAGNLAAIVTQGPAAALSGAWPVETTDGTRAITIKAASTAAGATDTAEVVALSPNTPLPTGSNTIGSVNVIPPTLTKGTQGSTGFSTQDLKDAGRTYVIFTANAVAGVTSETLLTVVQNKQGTATTGVTNYTITNNKTLRIQSITLSIQSGSSIAEEWIRVLLRHNTAGATTTSSSLVYIASCGTSISATAAMGSISVPIPDGIEFFGNGTQTIGVSHISSATTNVESVTVCGYEY